MECFKDYQGLGFKVQGSGLGVSDLRFGVWGLGFPGPQYAACARRAISKHRLAARDYQHTFLHSQDATVSSLSTAMLPG